MRRSLLLLVLIFLALPVASLAQQQVITRDPQAVAILHATLATMGGQGAAAIQDTVVHATVTPPASLGGNPGTLTITTKGAGMLRTDGAGGGKTASTIFNNGRELRSTGQGWTSAHASNATHERIAHLPALMLFYEIARAEISVAYVGEETLEGHSVHHISIARVTNTGNASVDQTLTHNSELEVFVDAQTNMIAKISYRHVAENDWRQSLPMEIYYSDYRTVNGIAIPFHQRHVYAGHPIGEIEITSVAVNQGTPDAMFKGN